MRRTANSGVLRLRLGYPSFPETKRGATASSQVLAP